MSSFVIDASIVLAWCFPDEQSSLAQSVAERFKRGDTALATAFWPYEILNALLVGEKRKRISGPLVRSFLRDLATLPVALEQVQTTEVFFERTESLARKYNLTAYDAAYLDLAIEKDVPLATLDDHLIHACKKAGTSLVWV